MGDLSPGLIPGLRPGRITPRMGPLAPLIGWWILMGGRTWPLTRGLMFPRMMTLPLMGPLKPRRPPLPLKGPLAWTN